VNHCFGKTNILVKHLLFFMPVVAGFEPLNLGALVNCSTNCAADTGLVDLYCIEGISETTCASADFYCQSNNDHDKRTSCSFYEKSLQVNHRQNTQKERARYLRNGERGREKRRRERV
jgi:hypothetical protein